MPSHVGWTLLGGALVETPAVGGTGTLTELAPPLTSLVQQDFLDLFDRLFPLHWLTPLKDPGPGYEALQAFARMMQRTSEAVCTFGNDGYFTSAHGGLKATGEVEFYRGSSASLSGSAAAITTVGGGKATITGLLDLDASMVGSFLTLADCSDPSNNGSFLLTDYISPTSVRISNAAASAPDGNNGNILWNLGISVTVKAGTVVTTSRSGRDFRTTTDVVFYPGVLGPLTVQIEATAFGYDWNVPGEVLAADGTPLPGDIDTIKMLVEDPQMGDLTIQVRHLVATSGGRDAALDQLGRDRGMLRNSGESDATYRGRVGALPDTVSPGAVARACKAALEPFWASFQIIETWDISYQTCYDAPNEAVAGSNFDPTCFVYDDYRDTTPFRNRWMDDSEIRGCFLVVAESIQPLADTGMVWDDPAMNFDATVSPTNSGRRALTSFDVSADLGFGYLQGGFDGYDVPKRGLYLSLYQTLQSIKAAGTAAAIERKGAP